MEIIDGPILNLNGHITARKYDFFLQDQVHPQSTNMKFPSSNGPISYYVYDINMFYAILFCPAPVYALSYTVNTGISNTEVYYSYLY